MAIRKEIKTHYSFHMKSKTKYWSSSQSRKKEQWKNTGSLFPCPFLISFTL